MKKRNNLSSQHNLAIGTGNSPSVLFTSARHTPDNGMGEQLASDKIISGTNSHSLKITKQTFFGSDGRMKYQVSFAFNGVWQPERIFDSIIERCAFVKGLEGKK